MLYTYAWSATFLRLTLTITQNVSWRLKIRMGKNLNQISSKNELYLLVFVPFIYKLTLDSSSGNFRLTNIFTFYTNTYASISFTNIKCKVIYNYLVKIVLLWLWVKEIRVISNVNKCLISLYCKVLYYKATGYFKNNFNPSGNYEPQLLLMHLKYIIDAFFNIHYLIL